MRGVQKQCLHSTTRSSTLVSSPIRLEYSHSHGTQLWIIPSWHWQCSGARQMGPGRTCVGRSGNSSSQLMSFGPSLSLSSEKLLKGVILHTLTARFSAYFFAYLLSGGKYSCTMFPSPRYFSLHDISLSTTFPSPRYFPLHDISLFTIFPSPRHFPLHDISLSTTFPSPRYFPLYTTCCSCSILPKLCWLTFRTAFPNFFNFSLKWWNFSVKKHSENRTLTTNQQHITCTYTGPPRTWLREGHFSNDLSGVRVVL